MDVGVFAALAVEENAIPELVFAIERAVEQSFDKRHGMIIIPGTYTLAEQKRRVNICLDIFKVLRGDMGWSLSRAKDHLPRYLDMVLDGDDWEPEARSAWVPPEK